MNAQKISYPPGRLNPAGVKKAIYAFVEDILSFPVLDDPETATTLASLVEIDTAIVMKPGKQFFEYYGTLEEGELKCTIVGPNDGKGFENSYEFSYPGNDPIALGHLAATANRQIVWIVTEKNNVNRVVGSLEDPALLISADYSSGKKVADGRKTVITVKASAGTPAPIYTVPLASLLAPAA